MLMSSEQTEELLLRESFFKFEVDVGGADVSRNAKPTMYLNVTVAQQSKPRVWT